MYKDAIANKNTCIYQHTSQTSTIALHQKLLQNYITVKSQVCEITSNWTVVEQFVQAINKGDINVVLLALSEGNPLVIQGV